MNPPEGHHTSCLQTNYLIFMDKTIVPMHLLLKCKYFMKTVDDQSIRKDLAVTTLINQT